MQPDALLWKVASAFPGSDLGAAAFRQVRQQQIDMLAQLTGAGWQTPRETLWGDRPLSMIVTKTFQHTYEHGDTLLRMGIWWESILDEMAKGQIKAVS